MVKNALYRMVRYNTPDLRRINHALKVYHFAALIAEAEGCDRETMEIVSLSSILHDIGIHAAEAKHRSAAGPYQEIEGPPIARELIMDLGFPQRVVDRTLHIIGNHHSYDKIDGVDFQILVEADFLVNFAEEAMPREAVLAARQKLFRTRSGIGFFEMLYG